MNVFRGAIAFFISVVCGVFFSVKFKRKKEFYSNFFEFNNKLINKVSFAKETIFSIVENMSADTDFNVFVKSFILNKENNFKISYISKEDKDYFIDYLTMMGKGDRDSQIQFLTIAGRQIEEKYQKAIKEESKYKAFSIKMGILIGLVLFVILL